MTRIVLCSALSILGAVMPVGPAFAQSPKGPQVVAIRLGVEDNGQGITRANGRDCLVITPGHVVSRLLDAAKIIVSPYVQSRATLLRDSTKLDLVVLKIIADSAATCDAWKPDSGLAVTLKFSTPSTLGVLESLDFGGNRSNMPVFVRRVDDSEIIVEAQNPRDVISKGMSGSLLLIGGLAAGILYQADSTGRGVAYRLDYVEQMIGDTFGGSVYARKIVDTRAAFSVLDSALRRRDGSQMMQVGALETLLARGNTFSATDFSGVLLSGATLSGGDFSSARFELSDLTDAKATKANLRNARLTFTTLTRARFDSAIVTNARAHFATAAASSWSDADLSGSNFWGSDLHGADFRGADLRRASLTFSDLRRARFDGADLRGAYLIGSILDSAVFTGAKFDETDLLGSALNGVSLTPLQLGATCRHATYAWGYGKLQVRLYGESSSGDESEIDGRVLKLTSLGDQSLRKCTSPDTSASGFDARYPEGPYIVAGIANFVFPHRIISAANRRTEVSSRVRRHLDILFSRLRPEFNVRDSAKTQLAAASLRTRASTALVSKGEPQLDEISFPAIALGLSSWKPDSSAWVSMALARWQHDVGSAMASRSGDSIPSPSVYFPPGIPWNELPRDDRVNLYREFLLRQAEAPPSLFSCKAVGSMVPYVWPDTLSFQASLRNGNYSGYTRKDTVPYRIDFAYCASLGLKDADDPEAYEFGYYFPRSKVQLLPPFQAVESQFRLESAQTLVGAGLVENRLVLVGRKIYGIDWVVLALPSEAAGYEVRTRPEAIVGKLDLRMRLKVQGFTLFTTPARKRIAVISVVPLNARLDDGTTGQWMAIRQAVAAEHRGLPR